MARLMLALAVALACALSPQPAAAEDGASLSVDPLFEPIAAALQRRPALRELSLAELLPGDCPATEGTVWVVSSDDGDHPASCVGDGRSAPRCADFAGHDLRHLRRVLCTQTSLPLDRQPPPWALELIQAARRSGSDAGLVVKPVGGKGVDALWLGARPEMQHCVGIAANGRWYWKSLSLLEAFPLYQSVKVIDTSRATGSPSFGVISTAYDGGSGLGQRRSRLRVLRLDKHKLTEIGAFPLGYLFWSWSPQEKEQYLRELSSDQAMSLRDRPHIEARLAPRISSGTLLLELTRRPSPEMKERYACTEDGSECPLEDIQLVLRAAGRWRWNGNSFARPR